MNLFLKNASKEILTLGVLKLFCPSFSYDDYSLDLSFLPGDAEFSVQWVSKMECWIKFFSYEVIFLTKNNFGKTNKNSSKKVSSSKEMKIEKDGAVESSFDLFKNESLYSDELFIKSFSPDLKSCFIFKSSYQPDESLFRLVLSTNQDHLIKIYG